MASPAARRIWPAGLNRGSPVTVGETGPMGAIADYRCVEQILRPPPRELGAPACAGCRPSTDYLRRAAKALLCVLRSRSAPPDIDMQADGFCRVSELIRLPSLRRLGVTRQTIFWVIRCDRKHRLEVSSSGSWIRACYGWNTCLRLASHRRSRSRRRPRRRSRSGPRCSPRVPLFPETSSCRDAERFPEATRPTSGVRRPRRPASAQGVQRCNSSDQGRLRSGCFDGCSSETPADGQRDGSAGSAQPAGGAVGPPRRINRPPWYRGQQGSGGSRESMGASPSPDPARTLAEERYRPRPAPMAQEEASRCPVVPPLRVAGRPTAPFAAPLLTPVRIRGPLASSPREHLPVFADPDRLGAPLLPGADLVAAIWEGLHGHRGGPAPACRAAHARGGLGRLGTQRLPPQPAMRTPHRPFFAPTCNYYNFAS